MPNVISKITISTTTCATVEEIVVGMFDSVLDVSEQVFELANMTFQNTAIRSTMYQAFQIARLTFQSFQVGQQVT